jgi:hypothetical protein
LAEKILVPVDGSETMARTVKFAYNPVKVPIAVLIGLGLRGFLAGGLGYIVAMRSKGIVVLGE